MNKQKNILPNNLKIEQRDNISLDETPNKYAKNLIPLEKRVLKEKYQRSYFSELGEGNIFEEIVTKACDIILKGKITKLEEQVQIYGSLIKEKMPNPPKILGEISSKDLTELIKPQIQLYMPEIEKNNFFISDTKYKLTSIEEAKRYSKESIIQFTSWRAEKHDCDEFSFRLMGHWNNKGAGQFAFGIIWSYSHAFNLFVDNNKKIWGVEPRNNKFVEINKLVKNKKYSPVRVVMI